MHTWTVVTSRRAPGKAAFDVRFGGEATYHRMVVRMATEAATSLDQSATQRPGLKPPWPTFNPNSEEACGVAAPVGPGISAAGGGR